nr:type II toxin-antitoxin system VapB family antitoxin [uncultured Emticicia sp.]
MTILSGQLTRKELIKQIQDISEVKSESKIVNIALEEYLRRLAGQELRKTKDQANWEGDLEEMRTSKYADITI